MSVMHPIRRRRLGLSLCMVVATTLAGLLIIYSLRHNIDLYLTPHEIKTMERLPQGHVRLGGLVQSESLQNGIQLNHRFTLTDQSGTVAVQYQGVLPALFAEGKGAVVEGHFATNGLFYADRVLAKHDANYHPPANP